MDENTKCSNSQIEISIDHFYCSFEICNQDFKKNFPRHKFMSSRISINFNISPPEWANIKVKCVIFLFEGIYTNFTLFSTSDFVSSFFIWPLKLRYQVIC